MLTKLSIKNIALIESAEIPFTDGLNVLSGETGSGKSVIIESINFVLGAKADKALIRTGAEECSVCAEFDVSGSGEIKELFSEMDMEEEDSLIIRRRFSRGGKNSVSINGTAATVGMLKKFTEKLVDVHGQSEHFYLLSTANQLKLLDKFGGENIAAIKNTVKALYTELKSITSQLEELGGDESRRLMRLDVLNYQIREIEELGLKENEEEELNSLREKLLNQEKITQALSAINGAVDSEGGAEDILANAVRAADSISALGEEYGELYSRLQGIYAELSDIAGTAQALAENFDFSEYSLDETEQRLDKIKKIKRKYGNNYAEINDFLERAKEEKDRLEHFNETAAALLTESEKLKKELYKNYCILSDERKKNADIFSKNVTAELKELNMSKAEFRILFHPAPQFYEFKFDSPGGFDSIEFMFSANLGEPLKPLSFVISGGEMSRFMLSVKAQSAKFNEISTFIFDEIDAGISGKVARVVAEKLCRISRSVQVIAISHLPQIVSFADNSLYIYKDEADGATYTGIKVLSGEEKTQEVARLTGGAINSDSALNLAKSLIESADQYKKSL